MTSPRQSLAFSQVDVFTQVPTLGNPVAVVHDAGDVADATMQGFTDWTNLSEATFLLPPEHPDADYRLRIFCPGRELPFAGHPTLGSAHAWLAAGGVPRGEEIVQECGVGLVRIRRDADRLAFAAPPLRRSGPLDDTDVEVLARGLGLRRDQIAGHQWCDNGPGWRGLLLDDAELLLSLTPDPQVLSNLDVGLIAPRADGEADFEVRAFFPGNTGMTEDPVTGSLNAALAQWLIGAGIAPHSYRVAQGTALGRAGRVDVHRDGDEIWIGGSSVEVITGKVHLPLPRSAPTDA